MLGKGARESEIDRGNGEQRVQLGISRRAGKSREEEGRLRDLKTMDDTNQDPLCVSFAIPL